MHFAATIERAEKQVILARHGRRFLNLLDDTPVVPGDARPAFEHADQARQILNDAEEDLRDWQPNLEPIPSAATGMGPSLMPNSTGTGAPSSVGATESSIHGGGSSEVPASHVGAGEEHFHPTHQQVEPETRNVSGGTAVNHPTYAGSEAEQSTASYQ